MAKKIRNPNAFKGLSPRETRDILMDLDSSMGRLMDVRLPSGMFSEKQDILDVLNYFNDYKRTNKLTELSPEDMSKLKGSYLKERLAMGRADVAWNEEHSIKRSKKLAAEKAKREAAHKAAIEASEKTAEEAAEAAAKKLALQQTTKESVKQVAKNVGKGVLKGAGTLAKGAGALAGAPAIATALTAAELADIGINVGIGGGDAKLGKARIFQGEEAAYKQWADSQPIDRVVPTYQEYLKIRDQMRSSE